ncbi:hypothetical protein [Prochlorococcus sp. MIT 1341]|uniref:hypothetical protein n=1 Tax=Prochlorococcus sp. MIT 1341 TaxID=3096221 RepID=UPI002A74C6AA|nr:hypothetical protein [Prochlorococcus sp. MIT 1341]
METSLDKTLKTVATLALCVIAIELVPVSKKAAYWNRCLDSTVGWINEKPDLNTWSQKAKESLAVGVCNGAVYEPKLKTSL